jgi:hypothetical protein
LGESNVDGGVAGGFGLRFGQRDEEGCAFILEGGGSCGAACKPGSSYCDHHHRLCYLSGGSLSERRRLRETEALATAVGGRRGRATRLPPDPLLRRLENIARGFSRPNRSCIVRGSGQ